MRKRIISLLFIAFLLPATGLLPMTGVANRSSEYNITLVKPTSRQALATNKNTVGAVLKEEGYKISDFQKIYPSPDSKIMDKLQIFLYPKKNQSTDSFDQINPSTRRIHSRALPEGRELVIRGSRDGRSQDGEIVREPISKVIMEGVSNYKNYDVEQLQEEKMLLFEATGYSPHAQSTAPFDDGFSAIGLPAGYGMIAVDPSIIPLGTRVFVEGYGYAIAADVGADIQGRRVDLCFETHNNALQFGRKWVKVHILG